MMIDLLTTIPHPFKRPNGIPLAFQVRVSPEAAPCLTSSSRGLLWIDSVPPTGLVQVGVRRANLDQKTMDALQVEIVETIAAQSKAQEWGSVKPLTAEGLKEAIAYLETYDVGPLQALYNGEHGLDLPEGVLARPVGWLAPGRLLLVPQDTGDLGAIYPIGTTFGALVVHPARGIALLGF